MIYNKEVYGDKFTLKCESWNTRNSWGHEVTLYHNGTKIGRVKVRYYNRTWESYQYQNAIKNNMSNSDTSKFYNNFVNQNYKEKICKQKSQNQKLNQTKDNNKR